eukprot:14695273-Alexandrium_andersonii.AAC.1
MPGAAPGVPPRPDAVAIGNRLVQERSGAFQSAVGRRRRGPRSQVPPEARHDRSGRDLTERVQPGGGVGPPV